MKKSFALQIGALLLSIASAYAGNAEGNGGNSIVCQDTNGTIKSAELLDLYEARIIRGIVPELGALTIPYMDKVRAVVERLARLSPVRAAKYLAWADEFETTTLYLPGVTLIDVPDSDHVAVPVGCRVSQLVVQRAPVFPGDKRYTISLDIWNHLDSDNRAATVLHEIVYREAFEENYHKNSIASRYFNSILLSARLKDMTEKDFYETLALLPFSNLGRPELGEEGALKFVTGYFKKVSDGKIDDPMRIVFEPKPMTFYPSSGHLRSAFLFNANTKMGILKDTNGVNVGLMPQRLMNTTLSEIAQIQSFLPSSYSGDTDALEVWDDRTFSMAVRLGSVNIDKLGHLFSVSGHPSKTTGGKSTAVIYENSRGYIALCGEKNVQPAGVLHFNLDGSFGQIAGSYSHFDDCYKN